MPQQGGTQTLPHPTPGKTLEKDYGATQIKEHTVRNTVLRNAAEEHERQKIKHPPH